jgi:hypothetical protein
MPLNFEDRPWTAADAWRTSLVLAVGAMLLGVAWFGAATKDTVEGQVGYGVAGVVGVCVIFAGGILWLVAGRRSVGLRIRRLLGEPPRRSVEPGPPHAVVPSGGLVAGDGVRHFHLTTCPMAAGRTWPVSEPEEHERAGRQPCGICLRGTPPDPRGQP